MTDTPHTFWHAASTRPLDEIESKRCDGPECELVQEFRALFNEIHRLRAALEGKPSELTMEENAEALDVISEQQANGWVYGTHPREKARIVLAALLERFTLVKKP